ncbi:isochorismate synthase [Vibrio nitrifigilis]|uniref:Isochorismate synthase MenF n=1 Tax=Vibrio nitrifigilis TaxID=2789781 RepID=A0ABS0GB58_9VIBR|nr:isochorismate synthase [Vibrio nitrifigilis]MBF8999643.1 isochorismate synthase [Vibrio nitrifigilis]
MPNFHQFIHQLITRIQQAKEYDVRIELPLDTAPEWSLIDWLDAQPIYPKFYWQSRDASEEVVALGALATFTEPTPAYAILGEQQRVWGGRSFDGRTNKNRRCMSALFFLPQIEVIRRQNGWFLAANINHDVEKVIQSLQSLVMKDIEQQKINTEIVDVTHSPTEAQWASLIDDVLCGIDKNAFKKVVLARETRLALSNHLSAAQLLNASKAANHHSFHFMLVLDDKHSFMGSTPERLYQRSDNQLYTEALAGTIGRGQDRTEDEQLSTWLLNDEKNVNENQYVVDDIVDRITPLANKIEVEEQVSLVKLRKVQHLRRKIAATLNTDMQAQLLDALQPTAAVAGLPRKEAYDFILEKEPFIRGWYAGSMGYFSLDSAEFCVAIRSALVLENEVRLFAGAGIVPGSIAEHEWQELNKKMSTLKSLIEQSQPLEVAV